MESDQRYRSERETSDGSRSRRDHPSTASYRSRSRSRSHSRSPHTHRRQRSHSHSHSPEREQGEWPPVRNEARRRRRSRTRSRSRSRSRERDSRQRSDPHSDRPARHQIADSHHSHDHSSTSKHPELPPSTSLMIRNLVPSIDETRLAAEWHQQFPQCAFPIDMRIIRDRGTNVSRQYAFAEMDTVDQAIQVFDAAHQNKWMLEGRHIVIAYGVSRRTQTGSAVMFQPQPQLQDWQCPRCQHANTGRDDQCQMCNIARAVVAHGTEATIAMSTSLKTTELAMKHGPIAPGMNTPLLPHPSHHHSSSSTTSLTTASTPPDESLIESISNSKVLFVSDLAPATTLDTIRERFVPFAFVKDVIMPLSLDGLGTSLGLAFVVFESEADCITAAERLATGCTIDDHEAKVEVASATQFNFVLRHQHRSWLAQSNATAKHRFSSAVGMATTHALNQVDGRQSDVDWNRVVSEQAAVYADSLVAPATVPARPPGLAASFLYDMSSGYWHDASTGYYFHAATNLYYHAQSGTWSRWDPQLNQYITTDEHGQPVSTALPVSIVAAQYLAMKTAAAFGEQMTAAAAVAPAPVPSSGPISFSIKPTSTASLARKPETTPSATTTAPTTAPTTPPTLDSTAATHSFLDPSRLACLLCQRKLPSLDQLLKHEKQSQLHLTNLAAYHAKQAAAGGAPTTEPQHPTSSPPISKPPPPLPSASVAPAPRTTSTSNAVDDYRRQVAQFETLDREEAKRPMLK